MTTAPAVGSPLATPWANAWLMPPSRADDGRTGQSSAYSTPRRPYSADTRRISRVSCSTLVVHRIACHLAAGHGWHHAVTRSRSTRAALVLPPRRRTLWHPHPPNGLIRDHGCGSRHARQPARHRTKARRLWIGKDRPIRASEERDSQISRVAASSTAGSMHASATTTEISCRLAL
jgi:hypothetical protein